MLEHSIELSCVVLIIKFFTIQNYFGKFCLSEEKLLFIGYNLITTKYIAIKNSFEIFKIM